MMADDEYPVDYIRVAILVFAETTNVLKHFKANYMYPMVKNRGDLGLKIGNPFH